MQTSKIVEFVHPMKAKNSNKIVMCDTIGPFMHKSGTLNWSKMPFSFEENITHLAEFEEYLKKAKKFGFNAITFDDVAHMVIFPWYAPHIRRKLFAARSFYQQAIALAKKHQFAIYVNADVLSLHKSIEKKYSTFAQKCVFLQESINLLLEQWPVQGVILRLGEADGRDVKEVFHSKILIKKPSEARYLIKKLLPVFEARKKSLIVRTWTIGMHVIGDLIWNTKTYEKIFSQIQSNSLIVSLKYGEADFFSGLSLAKHFSQPQKKIIELQAKREHEGFGMLANHAGFAIDSYRRMLLHDKTIIGCKVFVNEGGWHKIYKRTLLDTNFWNDLNAFVSANFFANKSHKQLIKEFIQQFGYNYGVQLQNLDSVVKMLHNIDGAITHTYYIPSFTEKNIYLKRFRLPATNMILWQHVYVHPLMTVLLDVVTDKKKALFDSAQGIRAVKQALTLSKRVFAQNGQKQQYEVEHLHDFLLTLHEVHKYLFVYKTEKKDILRAVEAYMKKYPEGYVFYLKKIPSFPVRKLMSVLLRSSIRRQQQYTYYDALRNVFVIPLIRYASAMMIRKLPTSKLGTSLSSLLK